jgi:hypothetical protein
MRKPEADHDRETVDEDTTQAELCYGKLLFLPSLFHLCLNVGRLQYCCGLNVHV